MSGSSLVRITCVLFLSAASTAAAASSRPKVITLDEVIRQASAKQKQITTLEADFRQEKVMAMMTEPQVSSGTFVYATPDRVIWTYTKPSPITMLISDGWLSTWYPELKKVEKLEISRYQDRIFRYMAAPGSLDELRKYFDFTFRQGKSDPEYTLELVPKTKALQKRVRRITIWIDRDTLLTSRFEYIDGEGDLTRYEFSNVRINNSLPKSTFELRLPPDVRVEQVRLN